MKNFIVPVDFSVESLNGLKMALLFSTKTKVNIQMIYVLPKTTDAEQGATDAEMKTAEARFKEIVREYSPQVGNDSSLELQY